VDEFSRDSNTVVLNHLVFALVLMASCPYETNVLAQHAKYPHSFAVEDMVEQRAKPCAGAPVF
jgi:hypothetical protein